MKWGKTPWGNGSIVLGFDGVKKGRKGNMQKRGKKPVKERRLPWVKGQTFSGGKKKRHVVDPPQ